VKKTKQAKNFIQQPSYPGGRAAINALIKKEMRYPEKALEAKVEGKVRLTYSLNHKGEVIRAKPFLPKRKNPLKAVIVLQ